MLHLQFCVKHNHYCWVLLYNPNCLDSLLGSFVPYFWINGLRLWNIFERPKQVLILIHNHCNHQSSICWHCMPNHVFCHKFDFHIGSMCTTVGLGIVITMCSKSCITAEFATVPKVWKTNTSIACTSPPLSCFWILGTVVPSHLVSSLLPGLVKPSGINIIGASYRIKHHKYLHRQNISTYIICDDSPAWSIINKFNMSNPCTIVHTNNINIFSCAIFFNISTCYCSSLAQIALFVFGTVFSCCS